MSLIIPKPVYELPAPKRHYASCVDIYMETKTGSRGEYQAVTFVFELATRRKDGKPFWPKISFGSSRNPRSKLGQMLTSWLGRTITRQEFDTFDLETLTGSGAELTIVHNETVNGTFANIGTVLSLPEDKLPPKPSGEYRRKEASPSGAEAGQEAQTQEGESAPF